MHIIKPISNNNSGYCMRLANGQGWYISATEQLRPWAEKLAAIMQLRVCEPNGYPRLIFTLKNAGRRQVSEPSGTPDEDVAQALTGWGWKAHDVSDMRIWSRSDLTDVICEIGIGEENLNILMMRASLYPIYQRIQDSGGLPLHAGLVERDGRGILLAAPRNTGKSTCCRRIPKPWYALCDEEALIVRNDQKKYLVHPFPTWSHYLMKRSEPTWNIQQHVPLTAIFFLEQAEVDEVTLLGQGKAAVSISNSAFQVCYRYWNDLDNEIIRTHRKGLFENACKLAKSIPAFRLRVSLTGRFWEKIEAVLQ
jgi:SynChlorMet cassette protein ScmC